MRSFLALVVLFALGLWLSGSLVSAAAPRGTKAPSASPTKAQQNPKALPTKLGPKTAAELKTHFEREEKAEDAAVAALQLLKDAEIRAIVDFGKKISALKIPNVSAVSVGLDAEAYAAGSPSTPSPSKTPSTPRSPTPTKKTPASGPPRFLQLQEQLMVSPAKGPSPSPSKAPQANAGAPNSPSKAPSGPRKPFPLKLEVSFTKQYPRGTPPLTVSKDMEAVLRTIGEKVGKVESLPFVVEVVETSASENFDTVASLHQDSLHNHAFASDAPDTFSSQLWVRPCPNSPTLGKARGGTVGGIIKTSANGQNQYYIMSNKHVLNPTAWVEGRRICDAELGFPGEPRHPSVFFANGANPANNENNPFRVGEVDQNDLVGVGGDKAQAHPVLDAVPGRDYDAAIALLNRPLGSPPLFVDCRYQFYPSREDNAPVETRPVGGVYPAPNAIERALKLLQGKKVSKWGRRTGYTEGRIYGVHVDNPNVVRIRGRYPDYPHQGGAKGSSPDLVGNKPADYFKPCEESGHENALGCKAEEAQSYLQARENGWDSRIFGSNGDSGSWIFIHESGPGARRDRVLAMLRAGSWVRASGGKLVMEIEALLMSDVLAKFDRSHQGFRHDVCKEARQIALIYAQNE